MVFERGEEGVRVQPRSMAGAECTKVAVGQRRLAEIPPGGVGAEEQRWLFLKEGARSTRSAGKRESRARSRSQQADFRERLQIDEVGISGERREGLVWRIAKAGRPQGARLPVAEAGVGQEREFSSAAESRAPIPELPGKEVGWSKTPAARWSSQLKRGGTGEGTDFDMETG